MSLFKKKTEESGNRMVKNTVMLYILTAVKMVLPLVTLPYLTRVLSKDIYGGVSYVKSIMQYMQLVVDFGFITSATADIVKVRGSKDKIAHVLGDVVVAKLLIAALAAVTLVIMILCLPILKAYSVYTILSYIPVVLTVFLMDFLFSGIEEMQIITIRYMTMKGISALLTFVFVKSDADLLWIPILDIIGSLVAVILVFFELKKREFYFAFSGFVSSLKKLKESGVIFISSMASTVFTTLNTILIGAFLTPADSANWGVCFQMIVAVQSMYSPIANGIYPHMIKTKSIRLIKKIAFIFMPIVTAGCIFTFIVAKQALLIIGGEQYVDAANLLRAFIPLLFFSFPVMLLGWPALGAIGKMKETTQTTIVAAVVQAIGLALLLVTGQFTVVNVALTRGVTEALMMVLRLGYCKRYKNEFSAA